eukprot:13576700-Alexandrium_andersonii.AAC.1
MHIAPGISDKRHGGVRCSAPDRSIGFESSGEHWSELWGALGSFGELWRALESFGELWRALE